MSNESKKTEFLAVGKWAAQYAGVRIVFDEEGGAWVDIETKVIHMPKRIAVEDIPVWIGTIIHESMHIKHTPKWLSDIPRDAVDKTVINALEDERIERQACRQLKAMPHILYKMVRYFVKDTDPNELNNPANFGHQALCNFSSSNSGTTAFATCWKQDRIAEPILKKLKKRHSDIIEKVMPTAFKEHLTEYYKEIDQLRAALQLKDDQPPPKGGGQGEGQPGNSENPCKEGQEGEAKEGEKGEARSSETNRVGKEGESLLSKMGKSGKPSDGCSTECIDMEGMAITEHSLPLDNVVRDRIKAALKKTLNTTDTEGNVLDTDELVSFMTGDVDELFYETKTEKKMKTQVYFLLDVSGSMTGCFVQSMIHKGKHPPSRLDVSHGAFVSLKAVVDELKIEDGCDIDSKAYVFGNHCEKWDMDKDKTPPGAGGGTEFLRAMDKVLKDITMEDPADKRILVVLTDGEVNHGDIAGVKRLLQSEAQDIRVVFISIGYDCDRHDEMFKHSIESEETANIALFECFEDAI